MQQNDSRYLIILTEKSENYVFKAIMNLLVIRKLINVTYGVMEYTFRNLVKF